MAEFFAPRLARRRSVLVVGALAVVLLLASCRPPATGVSAAAAGSPPAAVGRMGFYPGYAQVGRFKQWESTLGHTVGYVVQFADKNATNFTSSVWGEVVNAGGWQTLSDRVQLIESIPLGFGSNGDTGTAAGQATACAALQATVNGTYDSKYTTAANYLKSGGFGDAILRLGWEYDGSWYPWSAAGNCSLFQAAYRRVHDLFARVSPGFRYELTSTAGSMSRSGGVACGWPGDNYVDIVGLDVYDMGFGVAYNTATQTWADPVGTFNSQVLPNLRFQRDFAIAHGKPVSYPEWGLSSGMSGLPNNTGGDNPAFIQGMYDWFNGLPATGPGSLSYQSYFDEDFEGYHTLAHFPNARGRFVQLFGAR